MGDTPLTRQHGFVRNAKDAMHLFGSTSPSYLVMLSMDTLLPALYDGSFRQEVAYTVRQVEKLRQLAAGQGFLLPEGETLPTRLTLVYSPLAVPGRNLTPPVPPLVWSRNIWRTTPVCSSVPPGNREEDFRRLETLIRTLPHKEPLTVETGFHLPETVCAPREAILSPRRTRARSPRRRDRPRRRSSAGAHPESRW